MACPTVMVDLIVFDDLEGFADYMPEGVVLARKPHRPSMDNCLCGLDLEATARANGYEFQDHGDSRFTFLAPEVHAGPGGEAADQPRPTVQGGGI